MKIDVNSCSINTPFLNADNIYQDGTTPMYRDTDGTLYAITGHSHMGEIAMFSGTTLSDMKKLYPINTNFCVANAEFAFSQIRYPEGVKARGSIWPFGLYICPVTHRFFCFFHNETGWNGQGTGYDALGLCTKPAYDSDFRHIGLMHSDNEGKDWTFDRWVLTSNEVCFTELYNPANDIAKGQAQGEISLGSGDFSIFTHPDCEYIYLYYNIIRADMQKQSWKSCDVYVARTRKRTDGVMGDFVKYYDGAFCEAGNLGMETALLTNCWHPRVAFLEKYNKYMMVSVEVVPYQKKLVSDIARISFSEDMINWSEPQYIECDGEKFGNHYVAAISDRTDTHPCIIKGDEFLLLTNHNGKDVLSFNATIK